MEIFYGGKKMKKLIGIAAIVLLIAAIAVPVIARGPGGAGGYFMRDWGCDPQYRTPYGTTGTLTTEQRENLDKLYRNFYDETAKLRNDLRAKDNELNGVLSAGNPDTAKAKTLQKEISDLRAELDQKRMDFELEERKINPDARYGRGFGNPMTSRGSGMNPGGWNRSGTFGPDACWR